MRKMMALLYGILCFLVFIATFLYAVGFVGNIFVPKSVDSGAVEPLTKSLLINLGLLALPAVQHGVLARPWFKRRWTGFAPEPIERGTYALLACLALLLLFRQWHPVPGVVWNVEGAAGRFILWTLFWLGWLTALFGTFLINHSDLVGLRQVYLYFRRRGCAEADSRTPPLYGHVRHPVMLGFITAFWATPRMTWGLLLFACATTLYIVVALRLEGRELVADRREDYVERKQGAPALLPLPRRGGRSKGALTS